MSLEQDLANWFKKQGWTWSIKGKGSITPDEDDMVAALDEAARVLYSEAVGSRLSVGRLIIEKKHHGFDVYVYVGPYI